MLIREDPGQTRPAEAGRHVLPPAVSALLHNGSTILLSMDCLTPLLPQEHDGYTDGAGAEESAGCDPRRKVEAK